jgi:hypothetical protein
VKGRVALSVESLPVPASSKVNGKVRGKDESGSPEVPNAVLIHPQVLLASPVGTVVPRTNVRVAGRRELVPGAPWTPVAVDDHPQVLDAVPLLTTTVGEVDLPTAVEFQPQELLAAPAGWTMHIHPRR